MKLLRVLFPAVAACALAVPVAAGQAQSAAAQHSDHDVHATPASPDAGDDPDARRLPRTPIPVLTDADRAAAVPATTGFHPVHDRAVHGLLLVDRLEIREEGDTSVQAWGVEGWLGTDIDRLRLRSEGMRSGDHTRTADVELFYGRSVTPWWDVLAGIRHDARPRGARTFAALGIQGRTPFFIEGSFTAYVGDDGRTAARVDLHYDTAFTGRLILQWQLEADAYGKSDASRGIGRGLSHAKFGARLRYEIVRRFAPYLGFVHERAFGRTAGLLEDAGAGTGQTSAVIGIRTWF